MKLKLELLKSAIEYYFLSLQTSEKEKLGSPDYTSELVLEFVNSRVEAEKQKTLEQNSEKKSHQKRAPYLAQLELLRTMTGRSSPEAHRIGMLWLYNCI